MQDNELQQHLEKMIAGDQIALGHILSLYEKPIYNHLLRLTRNNDDAAHLLQDTFVKMYTKRDQIDPASNFKNWLYKIATNTAYDHFRKERREQLISFDDEDDVAETIETEAAYTTVEQEIMKHDLEQALEDIQPHYRNILLLYYREGFS